jgi:hypothetical protein
VVDTGLVEVLFRGGGGVCACGRGRGVVSHICSINIFHMDFCLQEEPDEHGQGKWEGKQEGKSDKRITIYSIL